MYMEPIVAVQHSDKQASSTLLRRTVGMPVLVASAVVMVPWLVVTGAVSGVVLGARGLVAAPRTLGAMLDYAGRVALGR